MRPLKSHFPVHALTTLVLQRTFDMVSFCHTLITDGGQNERDDCNGACDGTDPAGH